MITPCPAAPHHDILLIMIHRSIVLTKSTTEFPKQSNEFELNKRMRQAQQVQQEHHAEQQVEQMKDNGEEDED
jgi:hypothetical protein